MQGCFDEIMPLAFFILKVRFRFSEMMIYIHFYSWYKYKHITEKPKGSTDFIHLQKNIHQNLSPSDNPSPYA